MSNSDDDEDVGYGKPPRKHRFSKDNQPSRRVSKRRKSIDAEFSDNRVAAELLDQLTSPVRLLSNGKPITKTYLDAFIIKLVKNAIEGSTSDQLRLLEFLKKNGLLEFYELQIRLEREIREERANIASYERKCRALAEEVAKEADVATLVAFHSATLLRQLREACSCGCFEGDLRSDVDEIEKWLQWVEEMDANHGDDPDQEWHAPSSKNIDPSNEDDDGEAISFNIHRSDQAENPDDPFYTGMIGND